MKIAFLLYIVARVVEPVWLWKQVLSPYHHFKVEHFQTSLPIVPGTKSKDQNKRRLRGDVNWASSEYDSEGSFAHFILTSFSFEFLRVSLSTGKSESSSVT